MVAASLKPGGRAAVMVGDGANIKTQESILAAGKTVGLRGVAAVTMALTHNMVGSLRGAGHPRLKLRDKSCAQPRFIFDSVLVSDPDPRNARVPF